MATVKLKIEGKPGDIGLKAFIVAVQNWLNMLMEVDAAISRESKGTLEWVIADVSVGSLQMSLASRSRIEGKNFGPEVAQIAVAGLGQIERDGTTPPYVSHQGLSYAKSMLKTIGSNGISGIEVAYQSDVEHLTAQASVNVDLLLPTTHTSLGSIEGRIEAISIHGDTKFVVYQDGTNKAVTCKFPREWLDRVKAALGGRVSVAGVVHWNRRNEPVRVDGEDLREMKSREELPSIVQLAGSIPDLTGTLSTEEYLRRIREHG